MPAPHDTYGNLFSPSGVQTRFSASSLKDWQRCPRYYFYTWIEGWRSNEEGVHTIFGSHYARALQHFYLTLSRGDDRETALRHCVRLLLEWTWDYSHDWERRAWDEGGEDICRTCGVIKHHTADNCLGRPWDPEAAGLSKANLKNRWTLIRTFIWYVDEWKDDIDVFILDDGKPAVELKFEFEFSTDISFVGTIDRVARVGDDLLILDQKTTGSTLSPYALEPYDLDVQMSLYPFAGRLLLDEKISGVLIDAAQIAVGFSRFYRYPTYRTEAQLEEFIIEITSTQIPQMQDATEAWHSGPQTESKQRYLFPRNFSGCTMYGRCAFFDICRKSPEVRTNFLRANFTKRG